MPDIFVSLPGESKKDIPYSSGQEKIENKNHLKISKIPKQFLSAYMFMPDDIRFETQAPGESIILLLRRHWITNFAWVGTGVLLIIMPIILIPALAISGIVPPNLPGSFMGLTILVWYLMTFSYILVNFLLWYFTVSIVTNDRIVDIDFINILYKKFAETRIVRIEDVTNKTGGFIQALFDYGDVIVQTAAKEAMFQFESVAHPEKVVRIINELMGKTGEKE